MIGIVLVPAFLLLIIWVAIRSPRFSGRRAALNMRSVNGSNAGLAFAVFGLAELVTSAGGDLAKLGLVVKSTGTLLGALLAVLIVALVLVPRAEGLLTAAGAVMVSISAFVEYGPAGGILFLVVVVLAMTFLMFIRGLAPGRR